MDSNETVKRDRKLLKKSALILGGVLAFGVGATYYFSPNIFDSIVYGVSSQRAPQTPDVGAHVVSDRTHSYNRDLDGDGFNEAISCLHFDGRNERRLIEYDGDGKIQYIPFRLEDEKIVRLHR